MRKPCDCLKHMAGRLAKNVVTGAVVTVELTPAEDKEHLVVVADLSVASGGLVSALLAAGASPEIVVMGPTTLRPYGTDSRPITVTKQVRLGRLEFNTGCGPLMLRGLRVWIDEAEAAVELTLGLPVMQKLGYSEQTLLENPPDAEAVRTVLMAKVAEAEADGMEEPAVEAIQDLLLEFQDVFRLRFGRDPPVRVEPLKVHLQPGSEPVKSGLKRYPPTHM
ncbi:hypothetical protein DYB28_009956, partial [Aphanomyces astaci]